MQIISNTFSTHFYFYSVKNYIIIFTYIFKKKKEKNQNVATRHRVVGPLSSYKYLLDDGSPTPANLRNDHGFISEEY